MEQRKPANQRFEDLRKPMPSQMRHPKEIGEMRGYWPIPRQQTANDKSPNR